MFGVSFLEYMRYEILVTLTDILDMPQEEKNVGVKNPLRCQQINGAFLFPLFLE